jgi:hypothetical protein
MSSPSIEALPDFDDTAKTMGEPPEEEILKALA